MANSRSISGLKVPLSTDCSGLGKGLMEASTMVDKFYASVRVGLANSPLGKGAKAVSDFGKGFSALSKSVVAPLAPVASGIGKIAQAAKTGVAEVSKLALNLGSLAVAGAGTVAVFAKGGLSRIGKLGDTSLQIGIASDKLTELQFAALATGASAEDLNGFIKNLNGTVHAAIGVISPASEAFQRLGTSAESLSLLTPDKQFAAIKLGFDGLPDAAAKADAAVKIGGEAGLKLFKLLGLGAKEFEALKAKSATTGFTVKPEDLAKVQATNTAFSLIGATLEGVTNKLAVALAPAISVAADSFTNLFAGLDKDGSFFGSLVDGMVGGVAKIADTAVSLSLVFRDVFSGISKAIGSTIAYIGKLLESVASVVPSLQGVADSVKKIGKTVNDFGVKQADGATKAREAFEKSKPSATILKAYSEFTAATQASAKATAQNTAATVKAATANIPLLESIGKLKTEFANSIADSGLTAEDKQIAALQRQRASLKDVIDLKKQSAAVREAGKRDSLAEDLRESTKFPIEKLSEDLNRINQLVSSGKITQTQAIRGAAAKTSESGVAGGETKLSGALSGNGSEGRSYLLSQILGRPQDALAVAKQGLAATGQSNNYLGQIATLLKSNQTGTIQYR